MFVYCIYLGESQYFGSTLNLQRRQNLHNARLRGGKCKNRLYEKARELGIEQLTLIPIYEGEDYIEVEHELICNNDCLNMCGARYDRERALRLHREAQKRYRDRLRTAKTTEIISN